MRGREKHALQTNITLSTSLYSCPEPQSLLCSESMLSSTPPSDDSQRQSQEWKNKEGSPHRTVNFLDDSVRKSQAAVDSNLSISNGADGDHQMNGPNRPSMTGGGNTSNENLSWLADVAASQSQNQRPTMLLGNHESHSILHSGSGSLFRPPLTVSDYSTAQRMYSSQYPSLYTTASLTGTTISPYYSGHGQTSLSALNPYGAFYPSPFPSGYSHSSLMPRHYLQIESYSAVLAGMGSHVQAHAQAQLPRSPFLSGPLSGQYAHMAPTTSPGPSIQSPRPLTPGQPLTAIQYQTGHLIELPARIGDDKSPKGEISKEGERSRSGRTMSPTGKGDSPRNLGVFKTSRQSPSPSSPNSAHVKPGQSLLKDSSKRDGNRDSYKVPTGKEGSLKHRILTRPPNIYIEPTTTVTERAPDSAPPLGKMTIEDDPSPKRSKSSLSRDSSHLPPIWLGAHQGQSGEPPPSSQPGTYSHSAGYVQSQPHYPAHFMKGSIIQLASGELKRVEDLRTDDFVNSAELSGDLKIDSSTVVRIEENAIANTCMLSFSVGEQRVQVTVEAAIEHPFFVFGQGWSSCSPEKALQRYGLTCHKLSVGDVCISLTHKDVKTAAPTQGVVSAASEPSSSAASPAVIQEQPQTPYQRVLERSVVGESIHGHQHQNPLQPTNLKLINQDGRLATFRSAGAMPHRKRRWSAPDHLDLGNGISGSSGQVS